MTAILKVRILSHWRAGTGRDRPGTLDETCQRDADDLPMVPGKHLKGLLSDAMRRAHEFGWTGLSETDLFGGDAPAASETETDEPGAENPYGTVAAKIRVDSARLPAVDRGFLTGNGELIEMLFETRRSTAMRVATGAAKPGSLRFDEVAVPMTLEAQLIALDGAPLGWEAELAKALPLVRAVGAHRTRGLGRSILALADGGET